MKDGQTWTESEPSAQTEYQINTPGIVERIPVRSVEAGQFKLQTWVERLSDEAELSLRRGQGDGTESCSWGC
jgi:hypothetical protein